MVDLTVIGAVNWDVNIFVKDFAETGGEVPVQEVSEVPGGKGANVAVAAARILGEGRVSIIGALGVDEVSERQIRILIREGIDTSGLKQVEEVRSGHAYIIIDGHGRKMIHTLFGANLHLLPQDIAKPRYSGLLKDTKMVALIDPVKKTISYVTRKAMELGKTAVFTPGVRCIEGIDGLAAAIKKVDYLVGNMVEMNTLVRRRDLDAIKGKVLKVNPNLKILVTLGPDGSTLLDKGKRIDVSGVDPNRFGLKVVNTTGCGDAFLGVFCASKIQGYSDPEAMRRANLAAAIKATRSETRGSPTAEELQNYLNKTL